MHSTSSRKPIAWGAALALVAMGLVVCIAQRTPKVSNGAIAVGGAALIVGRVVDERGPIVGARIRIKGQSEVFFTNEQGQFKLAALPDRSHVVTAAKEGYGIGGHAATVEPFTIRLVKLPPKDYAAYEWVDPTPDAAAERNCGNCHAEIYREWSASGHARSATNRHFLNLFQGADWQGRPNRGWSLAADYPLGRDVCAACHAPTAAHHDPAADDAGLASGVAGQGVHCDFCHKIAAASVENVGLTHGRFGLQLLRPAQGQLFFGPLDDVDRGEDAYSPLFHDSRLCASCHQGIVFGMPVYTTYSEWLASPARREGKQCQTCHMAPTGSMTNVAPGTGGIERNPATLASHDMLPGGKQAMLLRAVQVDVELQPVAAGMQVRIRLTAENVGHRVPTGFVDRHLILHAAAEARDAPLAALSGPRLPSAAGAPLAGQPGLLLAKLLSNAEGESPVPFWRAANVVSDTRLEPGRPTEANFVFPAAAERVHVRLIYRPFWAEVARAKNWPDNDLVIHDRRFPLP